MATTPSNTDVFQLGGEWPGVPISGTSAINQGDLLMWDTAGNAGNGGARVPASQADMATYLGTAGQTNPVTSIGGNINNTNVEANGKVVQFKTTPGETYKHFDKVFFNETLDAQTIVKSTNSGARTVAVGYVQLPENLVAAGITSLTGASGVTIPVVLTPNYPAASAA